MADRGRPRATPRYVSVTTIAFRRWWHVPAARRHWVRLTAELAAAGVQVDSAAATSWRRRQITITTLAVDERTLHDAAACDRHVQLVRWTISRRRSLWSAVYTLSGWSSMSGPPTGSWALRQVRDG